MLTARHYSLPITTEGVIASGARGVINKVRGIDNETAIESIRNLLAVIEQ